MQPISEGIAKHQQQRMISDGTVDSYIEKKENTKYHWRTSTISTGEARIDDRERQEKLREKERESGIKE